MTKTTKKACVFDFDGTLVDSMDGFADIAARVMYETYDTPFDMGRENYLKTSGIPFFQQLELMRPKDPRNEKASALFEEEKKKDYLNKPVYGDVLPAFKALKEMGIKTVVSSNNFQHLVDLYVEHNSLTCDMVLGYKDGFAKGRDHFLFIMSRYGLDKKDILFVGDSIKDMERARDNDIDFVGRTGIFSAADFTEASAQTMAVDSLIELVELLKKGQI